MPHNALVKPLQVSKHVSMAVVSMVSSVQKWAPHSILLS